MKKVYVLSKYIIIILFLFFYGKLTGQDYSDSDGRIIWNASANLGFNNNISGIGRDDNANQNIKQSANTIDDITIGIKEIAHSNNLNSNNFFADKTFLMWGHNNASTTPGSIISKNFGSSTDVNTLVHATPIERIWKIVVTDSVPTIKLSVPLSMVSSTNSGNDEYVMIIANDANFTSNVTSTTMKTIGNSLEVDFYFEGTKFITFGSTSITEERKRALSFDNNLDTFLTAGNVNDLSNTDFTISVWVKRSEKSGDFDLISKRNFDSGLEIDGNYTSGYSLAINSNNQVLMQWKNPDDSSNNILQSSNALPDNKWQHIAVTYNSNTNLANLFINGSLEVQNSNMNQMHTPSDGHFIIGATHHIKRQQKFDGSIDEIRIWNLPLTEEQIQYTMNQEIEKNNNLYVNGKILPTKTTKNEIGTISWSHLIAYYPMNKMVFGSILDESINRNDASMINYNHIDYQTAPLPYKTAQDGNWDDETTWVNGNLQYLPGSKSEINTKNTIDYNIIEINHNVQMSNADTSFIPTDSNGNRTVLGLIINDSDLQIVGNTEQNTGYSLTISHYLKLNGTIDLEGESQLIQTTNCDLDSTSSGSLERDQQGDSDTYVYNHWSSPVSPSVNASYTTKNVINNVGFLTSGYNGTQAPVQNADYWIWKFAHNPNNQYSQWQHVRSTGAISAGEGFTMKGPGTTAPEQNYTFNGLPHNGNINLNIVKNNDYLVGNPYPSSIDANSFLLDNMGIEDGGTNQEGNIINGTIYFWEHYANNSHISSEYEGGYAMYTLMGGVCSLNHLEKINNHEMAQPKLPTRYIPVGRGFTVSASLDDNLVESNNPGISQPIIGGNILFKNSQRVFKKESNQNINDLRQKLRISFNSPDGYQRQLLVGSDKNASNNFDLGYDGLLIEDNKEDLFWTLSNSKLIIQAVDTINHTTVLPLGTKINKEGLATFSIDTIENITNNLDIILHDKELNIHHNLKLGNYETILNAGEHLERFEILFNNNSNQLSTEQESNESLQLYYSKEKRALIVLNPSLKSIESLGMYNILGQSIMDSKINSRVKLLEQKINNVRTGYYILKLEFEGKIVSKKVLIN
ncbi:hypothetical protein N1F78_01335 [Seonamhaeicola sp. MEBiC1930]|uniref:LamG-like jellyroll fold domain-containing protein n=1 Tax=Seonamhaeicola sp. MEBiC01930 TaxID=2976768 RepID=UPI003252EC30